MSRTTILSLLALSVLIPTAAVAGSASVTPFPFMFYTPETELAGGATVLVYLRGEDPDARPTIVSPIFVYTAKSQTMLYLSGEIYLDRERWRVDALAGYTRYPDTFWGLGNDAPDAAEDGDDATA